MSLDLSLAQESYIEAIDELVREHGHAHVTDLARKLSVSKPSVVQMIERLARAGTVDKSGVTAVLSRKGREIAQELGNRHTLLRDFMINELGMDETTAELDACRMEHVVSGVFVRRLRQFLESRG